MMHYDIIIYIRFYTKGTKKCEKHYFVPYSRVLCRIPSETKSFFERLVRLKELFVSIFHVC